MVSFRGLAGLVEASTVVGRLPERSPEMMAANGGSGGFRPKRVPEWVTAVEKRQTGVETRFAKKICHRRTVGPPGKHGFRVASL